MKFVVPNYSCLQNPRLGGYRPQIPVISVLCPQLNLLNPPLPEKNSWVRHWFFTSDTPRCVTARAWMHIRISTTQALPSRNSRITGHVTRIVGSAVRNISAVVPWLESVVYISLLSLGRDLQQTATWSNASPPGYRHITLITSTSGHKLCWRMAFWIFKCQRWLRRSLVCTMCYRFVVMCVLVSDWSYRHQGVAVLAWNLLVYPVVLWRAGTEYYGLITFISRLMHSIIQGVPGGMDKTSGECSLCWTIPI